jgi:hypothetical protein
VIAAVVVAATLTKPQYQRILDRADARVAKADAAAHRALTPAATRADAARALRTMSAAERADAGLLARVAPPPRAAAVNAAIVHAERVFAAELDVFAHRVETAPTRAQAIAILHGPGPQRGPKLLERAIARLHALGYR